MPNTATPVDTPYRFRMEEQVRINYPRAPYRIGYVVADDGGPKVKVRWRAQDGPDIGRHVVAYRGAEHVQMFPRERLQVW